MSRRASPSRSSFQAGPPTSTPAKASDRLAVPEYYVVDPLLENLSPESTLQALLSIDAVPSNEQAAQDILAKNISQASSAERALGIRAAVAAQKLGEWYKEVQSWPWPKRPHIGLGKGFIPPSGADDTTYWGSLPSVVVEERETRIEEIRDGMDGLEVEELKEHVLNAHIPGRSRPSSANSTISVPPPLSYVQLSDFTAVITATILRALPLLSRLTSMLSAWHARLVVCRQIPGLLRDLRLAKSEVKAALDLLKASTSPTEKDSLYSITNYHAKRAALESTVLSAGRRMDRILDLLEGREDSLPEDWIDDLEAVEADFASWVIHAEKRTVENEWRRQSARPMETIAEEIGSLINQDLRTQRAGNNQTPRAMESEILADPPSPSPLPSNPADKREALVMPVTKMESAGETMAENLVLNTTAAVDPANETIVEDSAKLIIGCVDAMHETKVDYYVCNAAASADAAGKAMLENDVTSGGCDTAAPADAALEAVVENISSPQAFTELTPPLSQDAALPVPSELPQAVGHSELTVTATADNETECSAAVETITPKTPTSNPPARCVTPPADHLVSLPNLFLPHDSSKAPTDRQQSEEPEQDEKSTKKPLDSPIKLTDKQRPCVRRTSNTSDGSLFDYPSLVSSPEMPEPRTSSSLLETPPYRPSTSACQKNDHDLREDRLLHLASQRPSPRDQFAHGRTLSLPLQRFINDHIDVNYDHGSSNEDESRPKNTQSPAERRQKSKFASAKVEPLSSSTARLKKQLTAHPSLESIGPYKSKTQPANLSTWAGKIKSRSSSITKQSNRPKDQMDERINSILTSLPGNIHLVSADQDDDAISVASSVPFRRERLRPGSPQGTPSRSFTSNASLTLRPALGRRRHSHAPEESSVKLYHLHRSGKSAPTKLFLRTVGDGERVMVRVGGGWADLAEYLREYAIHHGYRHVSETPRVEVKGLSPRDSPSYSPPSSRVPSGSARPMPARPRSVLSNRPSSSLAVRKTRRSSNVSDFGDLRTTSGSDALNVSFSAFPDRRLSVSSNVSAGAMSSISELRHESPGAPAMPLGLAGPKPRTKHATISPESEAWVEDVLGQARRSSSLRPFKYNLSSPENNADGRTPMLPKSRSISDIGKAGSSKRVVLRGLR